VDVGNKKCPVMGGLEKYIAQMNAQKAVASAEASASEEMERDMERRSF